MALGFLGDSKVDFDFAIDNRCLHWVSPWRSGVVLPSSKKNCSLLRTGWVEANVGKLLNYNRTVISVSFRLIQDPKEGAVWPERCLSLPCVLF